MKFKVGQIVKWRGINGTIIEVVSEKKKRYKVMFQLAIDIHESELTDA
jgi:hypothetical protein